MTSVRPVAVFFHSTANNFKEHHLPWCVDSVLDIQCLLGKTGVYEESGREARKRDVWKSISEFRSLFFQVFTDCLDLSYNSLPLPHLFIEDCRQKIYAEGDLCALGWRFRRLRMQRYFTGYIKHRKCWFDVMIRVVSSCRGGLNYSSHMQIEPVRTNNLMLWLCLTASSNLRVPMTAVQSNSSENILQIEASDVTSFLRFCWCCYHSQHMPKRSCIA
jgi:hypothetical protein